MSRLKHTASAALVLAVLLGTSAGQVAIGSEQAAADWRPTASERLVRLPASYLKKAIERDFRESGLAGALRQNDENIEAKTATLGDLSEASERADGDLRFELKHQFLAEKQSYIRLMGERQQYRRKQAETKARLYQKLLRKLERQGRGRSKAKQELIERQSAARKRFDQSLEAVDLKLFGSSLSPDSKYSEEFAKNRAALDSLVAAISSHPMNKGAELDGQEISKRDYIRHLIEETEADLAILEQEEAVLGYMAKLVALDAMALAEDVAGEMDEGEGRPLHKRDVASAVNLFLDN